jgi:pilus assembly protein Flp/PilA
MGNTSLEYCVRAHAFVQALKDENGQDLVEYALVIAVICLGIVAGMSTLAQGINNAMGTVSNNLNSAVS